MSDTVSVSAKTYEQYRGLLVDMFAANNKGGPLPPRMEPGANGRYLMSRKEIERVMPKPHSRRDDISLLLETNLGHKIGARFVASIMDTERKECIFHGHYGDLDSVGRVFYAWCKIADVTPSLKIICLAACEGDKVPGIAFAHHNFKENPT